MDQLNKEQSSYASQPGYRQADFPYQIPKIDHAFIIENYRRLRMHQRDQLAHLRIPDELKRKIFNFREDQDLKFEKPELVIFNHPFRGKTVMTKQEVEKQLQKQRKNAQFGDEKQNKGQKIQQNVLNEMGLQQQYLTLKKAKMTRQKSSQQFQEKYQKKPKLTSNQPEKKIAQDINAKQQKKNQGNLYFISKERKHEESQTQRTQKMKQLIKEKQDSKEKSEKSKSKQKSVKKDKKIKDFKDMPIIGQQPVIVRDIKFDEKKNQKLNLKPESNKKGFFRPFGNQAQIKEFQKSVPQRQEEDQRLGSGQAFIKKRKQSGNYSYEHNGNKSLSEISAIQSKDLEQEDLSNSQSLNNALFLE